jgi:hypothetical protein
MHSQSRREWLATALLAALRLSAQQTPRRRLMGDAASWKARAAAIPPSLWKPRGKSPYKTETPNTKGNSGSAGYALMELIGSWLATGNAFYAEESIRVMRAACEYPHWGGFNHLSADIDLDAGDLLAGLGIAYDTLRDQMSEADRGVIRDKLVLQSRLMYSSFQRRKTISWEQNHTYIDIGGLWCTAVALLNDIPEAEVPEANVWYEFGAQVMHNAIRLLNSGDGAFYEGIGYWNYGMATHLIYLLDLFRNVTGFDTFHEFDSLKLQKFYLMHTLLPGGKYWLNVGDVADSTIAPARLNRACTFLFKLAREYRDPESHWLGFYFAQAGGLKPSSDPWLLAWFDPSIEPRDPRRSWPSFHQFQDLDLVTMRTSWTDDATHIALRCGPALGYRATKILLSGEIKNWKPGTGHVHPDLNSFTLFDHGEHIVVDTGYTEKKQTREHNTITVDGAGQMGEGQQWPLYTPWTRHGKIGATFTADQVCHYVRGEAANGYEEKLQLQRFDRHLLVLPDDDYTYLVIDDRIESAQPHQFAWLLHTNEPAIKIEDNKFQITANSRAATIHVLRPDHFTQATEAVRVTPYVNKDATADRGHVLTLSPPRGAGARFLAILTLHARNAPSPEVQTKGDGFRVIGPHWTDTLAPDGMGGGIATDGHHAVIRHSGSDIVRWSVLDAKNFGIVEGQDLCRSSRPISAGWDAARRTFTYELAEAADISVWTATRMARFRGEPGRHEVTLD